MSSGIGETLIYLGVGLLVYLLAIGPVDWSDAWVYVIMTLWPFFLIWWALFYIVGFLVLFVVLALIATTWEYFGGRSR